MDNINTNAAGIYIGSSFYMIAVGQGEKDVQQFGVYAYEHPLHVEFIKNIFSRIYTVSFVQF